jgi:protein Hikeshi
MFAVILPGRPCHTNLVTVSANQFAFSFPSNPYFSHVVVFMLPGSVLPPDTAAAVYAQLPGQSEFKLLGAIGNEKQSAFFKVNLPGSIAAAANGEIDMTIDANTSVNGQSIAGDINLGVSVESAANIQSQLAALRAEPSTSNALMRRPPTTKVLAQRIIKNAFNFLASFAGGPGGQEVVPLKSFQDWWTKFERRIENDPGFLERDEEC